MTDPDVTRHVSQHRFLAGRRSFDVRDVTIIHNEGQPDEKRTIAGAEIQRDKAFFELDAPVYEGDIVILGKDPRDGSEVRRLAGNVKHNQGGRGRSRLDHATVEFTSAPVPRVAAVRRLTFENLHPEVQTAAGDLYADGHHQAAISEAFKSLEVRVRNLTGIQKSGTSLMGDAFAFKSGTPPLDVATETGQSGNDEREGFAALFRGSMLGIRNPGAHELFKPTDAHETLEYLALASLLHRRIDGAKA